MPHVQLRKTGSHRNKQKKHAKYLTYSPKFSDLLPAHPGSFTHNFVSRLQRFYFSESQDAMVLQTCQEKLSFGLISLQLDPLI